MFPLGNLLITCENIKQLRDQWVYTDTVFQGSQSGPDACLDISSSFPNSTPEYKVHNNKAQNCLDILSFKEIRMNTESYWEGAARSWPEHLWKSGLHSDWHKGGLWKCSVEQTGMCCVSEISCPPPPFLFSTEMDPLVKRHLCFLLSLQDWMSWFRTHKCNFKFDCLLVYFMHLLLEEGETWF